MYINSDNNPENIDDWEVEMRVKKHHTHSKNLKKERKKHHKREWNTIVQKTKKFNWLEKVKIIKQNAQWKVQTLNLCNITLVIEDIASQAWAIMIEE